MSEKLGHMSILNAWKCSRNHEGFGRASCQRRVLASWVVGISGDQMESQVENISSLLMLSRNGDLGRHPKRHRAVAGKGMQMPGQVPRLDPSSVTSGMSLGSRCFQ